MSRFLRAAFVWVQLVVLSLLAGCTDSDRDAGGLWAVKDYPGSFEYRYGDPPGGADGRLRFANPLHDDGGWTGTQAIGRPPGRGAAEVLWLRTRLLGPPLASPMLYLRISGHDLAVFLDGRPVSVQRAQGTAVDRIASMGDEFLISLPPDYVGRTLVLRATSPAPLFGILGPPRLGESAAVALDLVRSNGAQGLVSLLFLLFAVAGLVLFVFQRSEHAYLYFAIFSFAIGIWNLTFTGLLGILIPWPLPRFPTRALGIALALAAFCSYVGAVLDLGPLRILHWLRLVWLAVFALFVAALLIEPRMMFRLILPVAILALLTMASWVTTAILGAVRGNMDAKLMSLGFAAMLAVMAPGILAASGRVSGRVGLSFHAGTVVWGLTLAAILLRRFLLSNRRTLQLHIERELATLRIAEQEALLHAAGNLAQGDLEKEIRVEPTSSLMPLAGALDSMRQDFRAKLQLLDRTQGELRAQVETLEVRNREIGHLNEELRRQIEQRSRRLIDLLLPAEEKPMGAALAVGDLLGERYRILRQLGKGGMGTVYEVERTTDHQLLAAKVLHTAVANRTTLSRFAREAQIMARLNHQHLVAIWDVDVTTTGTLYLVMELVQGQPLSQFSERLADLGWVCEVLAQIAEALSTLHKNGVVHRDLKPQNVMVVDDPQTRRPVAKLADFGISLLLDEPRSSPVEPQPQAVAIASISVSAATEQNISGPAATLEVSKSSEFGPNGRRSESENRGPTRLSSEPPGRSTSGRKDSGQSKRDRDLTHTGVIIGTPIYMAPELRFGSKHAQPAVDIFSFGVLAFELLTGQAPFPQSPVVICGMGGELSVPPLLRTRAGLAPRLASLIEACLATPPEDRPGADELAQAFRNPQAAAEPSPTRPEAASPNAGTSDRP